MRRALLVALVLLGACKVKANDAAGTPVDKVADDSRAGFVAPGVDLPQVAASGTVPFDPNVPVLVASQSEVVFEGLPRIQLRDGAVDPSERSGDARGRTIGRLSAALAAWRSATPGGEVLGIAIDHRLTFGLLYDLLYTAKTPPAGWKRFVVLVRTKGTTAGLPLALPDRHHWGDEGSRIEMIDEIGEVLRPGAADRESRSTSDWPLQLVLSISSDDFRVWSLSGMEGTLHGPRLRVPRSEPNGLTKVGVALAEIAKRRWAGKPRSEESHEIIVMTAAATPMQVVAEVVATVRATPAGEELFPAVTFALAEGLEIGPETAGISISEGASPSGRITLPDTQGADESSLTPDLVLAKIQSAYFGGIKACYTAYLAKDPVARGKVTLRFTVDRRGRTVGGAADGFAAEIDACIEQALGSWVFPIPRNKGGSSADASFSIALQLTPD